MEQSTEQAVPEHPAPDEEMADTPPLDDILALFENRETVMQEDTVPKQQTSEAPLWEEKKPQVKLEKTEKISEDEQAVMNAQMDENQKAPLMVYEHPPVDLLNPPKGGAKGNVQAELTENSQRLVDTLESFGIDAKIIGIVRGPCHTV